jgi:hypothetical protein
MRKVLWRSMLVSELIKIKELRKRRKAIRKSKEVRVALIHETSEGYLVECVLNDEIVSTKTVLDKQAATRLAALWVDHFHLYSSKH